MMPSILFFFVLFYLKLVTFNSSIIDPPEIIEVKQVWDESPHNAFTDIVFFKDRWFCVFRSGTSHGSFDGKILVIESKDLNRWSLSTSFFNLGCDLRDPKFSITSKGDLMIIYGQKSIAQINGVRIQSVSWLTNDGIIWHGPYKCNTGLESWRWSVTWKGDLGYSIAYSGKDKTGTLYVTFDGKSWLTLAENIFPDVDSYPNESSIVFLNDTTAYCLLRKDGGD